jgi:hypothetical protein
LRAAEEPVNLIATGLPTAAVNVAVTHINHKVFLATAASED